MSQCLRGRNWKRLPLSVKNLPLHQNCKSNFVCWLTLWKITDMKKIFTIASAIIFVVSLKAQEGGPMRTPVIGGNKKAMVGERIGVTDVTINYDRPGVKGREGKIYGTPVVHIGYTDYTPFGTAKKAPWRAGANENTTIEFSTDVKIEGKDLASGKYGFFVMYGPIESSIIFSKDNTGWGSYFYDEKNDALRVTVQNKKAQQSVEWLKYEFTEQTENSAVIALQWENMVFPFKVEVDLIETQIASFKKEMKGEKGFEPAAYAQAADFCLKYKTHVDEGDQWATKALEGKKDFSSMSTKAQFCQYKGQTQRADSLMKEAMKVGSMIDLHQYGKQLITKNKKMEALDVFTLNAKNHPKDFTTYVGLARGYSATGDFKKALANAKAALPLAPNEMNKQSVEGMIRKLESQKDIN